jgi:Undecaprenyl-phosphate glucose phosphotransferase
MSSSDATVASVLRRETEATLALERRVEAVWLLLVVQLCDFALPLLLGWLCYQVHDTSGPDFWAVCARFSLVGAVLAVLIFRLAGCYRLDHLIDLRVAGMRLFTGYFWLVWIGLLTAFLGKGLGNVSRIWMVLWLTSWPIAAFAARAAVARFMRSPLCNLLERVAIVGATDWAVQLCQRISQQDAPRVRIVGVFDDRRERLAPELTASVRPLAELLSLGRKVPIDRVVVALPLEAEARILALSQRVKALAVDIVACPDLRRFGLLCHPTVLEAGAPAIHLVRKPISFELFLLKIITDKALALGLLLLAGPLMLAIALGIRWTSPGPVLFRQRRHGYNNREFEMLKFRSMQVEASDASGGQQTRRNDVRVSRFGRFLRKTSLDELPQLLNVLSGDMSLVGPRPLPIGMRTQDLYNHEIVAEYAHRHRVRPGITGWAQVNGFRGGTERASELQQRVALDLYYIENWSVLFDLKILALTAAHLVRPTNAY